MNKVCSHDGCLRTQSIVRGLCRLHYCRAEKDGTLLLHKRANEDIVTPIKFVQMIAKHNGKEACVIWPFGIKGGGYGAINTGGKCLPVHRFVCIEAHGNPPTKKHHAAHSCGVRACVNPMHLSWKTASENQIDRIFHGTGGNKLNPEDVINIRNNPNSNAKSIAEIYDVSVDTINGIRSGRKWGWLVQF